MTMNRDKIIDKVRDLKKEGRIVPFEDMIATKEEIEKIKESTKINMEILDLLEKNIKPGVTTNQLDKIAYDFMTSKGAVSKFFNNPHILSKDIKCISIATNSEVMLNVSNTDRVLNDGDMINVCVAIEYNGYSSDISRMFMVGNVSDETKRLIEVSKECLYKGIEAIKPWKRVGNVFDAIEKHAKDNGYSNFDFIGHGIGLKTLEKLMFTYSQSDKDMLLVPGMVLSIEPVIAQGNSSCIIDNSGCVYNTCDGKLAAQWTQNVLVTEYGFEIIGK